MKILENNEYIDQYDFSSVINEQDNQQVMFTTKEIIDSGNYFTNSPPFQTKENLFARREPAFLKMRQSFIFSCFMFLGREVKIKNMMSWAYMTNNQNLEDRDTFWHNHHISDNDGTTDTISGIWYVYIPPTSNPDITGTEFAMDGAPNFKDTFFLKPNRLTWNVYPSKLWHRPGITDSIDYRFIFAADMEYYK